MKCPKCSLDLKKESYEQIEIDKCVKCKGTWLDSSELTKIIEDEHNKFDSKLVQETLVTHFAGIPMDEQRSVENCPVCQSAMQANNYDYQSGIIIDVCPKGHGVWLDENELEKVQIYREHWNKEAKKHKDEWIALARSSNESHKEKKATVSSKFLFSSVFKKIFG